MTIVTTDANGQTQTYTAEDQWSIDIPQELPFQVNMTYAEDPNFFAYWNYRTNVFQYDAAAEFSE